MRKALATVKDFADAPMGTTLLDPPYMWVKFAGKWHKFNVLDGRTPEDMAEGAPLTVLRLGWAE